MARKTPAPPQPVPANLPAARVPEAITKLERRLADFEAADPTKINGELYYAAEALCNKLSSTLDDIYGPGTIEKDRVETSAHGFIRVVMGGVSRHEQIEAFNVEERVRFRGSKPNWRFCESGSKIPATTLWGTHLRAYEGLTLHPDIDEAAGKLFHDGHYASAIENAVKALNNLVRYRSGLELDGVALMERTFSPANPILQCNELVDQSDREEQKGFMNLFCGAVSGLRNPRAHKLIKDDPERALEFIAFVSLLAKLADAAKKRKTP